MEYDNNNNNDMVSSISEAHHETLDILSNAWCNFAVQALQQPKLLDQSSILVQDNTMKTMSFDGDMASPGMVKMGTSPRMDGVEHAKHTPPWKSNDIKSWIWMQQAMHPELNYNASFGKKWFQWKPPFGKPSTNKWLKQLKEKRKEDKRLQRAQVHASLSIAGLAAALAAIAEEATKVQLEPEPELGQVRNVALAQATALVASQCALMAKSIGAKSDQLSSVIGSALSVTSTSDILTFTAAAATSLRGAATLKARGCKSRLNGKPILPVEMDSDNDFDFDKYRLLLAKGARLTIQTPDGRCMMRLISLHLNNETKVILRIMKRNMLNLITSKKECLVLDMQAKPCNDSEGDNNECDMCYQIVLATTKGMMKLDMADDCRRYRMWATTIDQMLKLSATPTKYELQFCKC